MSSDPSSKVIELLPADTLPVHPRKRRRHDDREENTNEPETVEFTEIAQFCPEQTKLVSVLLNDTRSKRIVLHARFEHALEKDAIIVLEKSPFPNDPQALEDGKVISAVLAPQQSSNEQSSEEHSEVSKTFPRWLARMVMKNDLYHRLLVTNGYELVNGVNVTIIHPAEPHHFKRYSGSGRQIIQETPEMYNSIIVPFLAESPRDLSWVENILSGTAEQNRVLWSDLDATYGFTLVMDFRWDEQRLQELHYLALARDPSLTCLRDLRSEHLPMLRRVLQEGRTRLSAKYSSTDESGRVLREDQIMAYLHYPPTFYRLHVHFVHTDAGDEAGTRAGRAHLLEEVIRNLELNSTYYAQRVMTIYLHDASPMLARIRASAQSEQSSDNCNDVDDDNRPTVFNGAEGEC